MEPFFFSVNPDQLSGEELDQFLLMGWFRTRQGLFTSSHVDMDGFYQVYWLRFAIAAIQERAAHRRIKNKNKKFRVSIDDVTIIGQHHVALHARYRMSIDFDGAWSIEECLFGDLPGVRNIFHTKCISVYDHDKLIAAGYFDVGEKAAASILHFFDPDYRKYSLGKFLILITLDYLKDNGYEYYYPGYVVQGIPKMNYKLFIGREWAEYFDPNTYGWRAFDESILHDDQSGINATFS